MLELEESFGEFRIFAGNELLILQEFFKSRTNSADKHSDGSSTSGGRNMRLPKLSKKPFDGNPLNWKTFYDTFLQFSLSNENYKLALNTLQERFGVEQVIIISHMNKLLELPSVDSVTNTKALRNLYDTVEAQIRSLTKFNCI